MNAHMPTKAEITLDTDITPDGSDYEVVRKVIEKISLDYRDQPSLEDLAQAVGDTPNGVQKLFTRWAGLSPKGFLQAVTLDHARRMLDELRGRKLLAGSRGAPAVAIGQAARVLKAIGDAALALGPDLVALEVNPLLARGADLEALDALAVWDDRRDG